MGFSEDSENMSTSPSLTAVPEMSASTATPAVTVLNGTRFTPVHLHVPDTSGTDFTGVLLW